MRSKYVQQWIIVINNSPLSNVGQFLIVELYVIIARVTLRHDDEQES